MGALDVRCPTCGAKPGDPCVSVHRGNLCRKPHGRREKRAQVREQMKVTAKRQRRRQRQIPDTVKAQVRARAGDLCEARELIPTLACSGRFHFHHVLPRSAGGQDTAQNLALLCSTHHAHAHAWPEQSYRLGLLRRRQGRRIA